jgi:mannose-6-phosphate isomerase-like protein (cupin superfamily)
MMKESMQTRQDQTKEISKMKILHTFLTLLLLAGSLNAESQYLLRTFSVTETEMALTSASAHYIAMFGLGDDSAAIIKGLVRYGNLNIDPFGQSKTARYSGEEHVIYVLDGTGIIKGEKATFPVSRNDFIYIPEGTRFSISNPRERKLSAILMSFRILPGDTIKPSRKLMIASADEVPFQVLGSHGPTTTFQLLLGTTASTRDKLAAAGRVSSLFVMDFASGGTNIPHRHNDEEEIYLILKGKGEIVAGVTTDGKEYRHASHEGDAWFFAPGTLIGFYSGNGESEEHARILAVRFRYPSR